MGVSELPAGRDAWRHRRSPPARCSCPCSFRPSRMRRSAATLGDVTGKPADPKLNVPSRFEQTSVLVLGQNNVNVWSRTVDRLAVAVTEECPYTIEIVEPKVPAGAERLDGAEGPGDSQAGLQGARFRFICPGTRRASARAAGSRFPRSRTKRSSP